MNIPIPSYKITVFILASLILPYLAIAQVSNKDLIKGNIYRTLPGNSRDVDRQIEKIKFDYDQKYLINQQDSGNNFEKYRAEIEKQRKQHAINYRLTNKNQYLKTNTEPGARISFLGEENKPLELPYEKLLQSTIRQDYIIDTDSFKNTSITTYKQIDYNTTYQCEILADENGEFTDTIKTELQRTHPLESSLIIGIEEYSKVNGRLEPINLSTGWVDDIEMDEGRIVSYGHNKYRYYASYQTIPGSIENEQYLSYMSEEIVFDDTTYVNTYSFYSDGNYSSKDERIRHKTLGELRRVQENFDDQGKITYGIKQMKKYNEQGQIFEQKLETYDVQEETYEIEVQHLYTYNELGRILSDEYSLRNDLYRIEYEWDEDSIVSEISKSFDSGTMIWENQNKVEYTYKEDTSFLVQYSYNGSDWVNPYGEQWFVYFRDENGNSFEVAGSGILGAEPYDQIDTTKNRPNNCQDYYKKSYWWQDTKYKLSYSYERRYNDQCVYFFEESLNSGWSKKYVVEESDASAENKYYIASDYTSDDPDINDEIDWKLTNHFSNKYNNNKPEGMYSEMIYYWGSGGWKNERYANSEGLDSHFKGFQLSSGAVPDDFDWWQELEYEYNYDEHNRLITRITSTSNSEDIPISEKSKTIYTHNSFGFETEVIGLFDGNTFTLTDSIKHQCDQDGYQTKTTTFFYDQDKTIIGGYRLLNNYGTENLDSICNLTHDQDSILSNGALTLRVKLNGQSPVYQWYDQDNELIGDKDTLEVYASGTYYLKAMNEYCSFNDSVKVWKLCDLSLTGDTIVTNNPVSLSAFMAGEKVEYTWKNNGFVLSNTGSIEIDAAGVYSVLAYDDSSYCLNSDSIKIWQTCDLMVTGDTIITKSDITLEADLDGEAPEYIWYNNGAKLGEGSSVTIDSADVYTIISFDNQSGCYGKDSIKIWQICDLVIAGDTLISEENVMLEAQMQGFDTEYKWQDNLGELIGDGSIQEIGMFGDYYLVAVDEVSGCFANDSIRIWETSEVNIIGDSILFDGSATITASLNDIENVSFVWLNEEDSILSFSNELITEIPGIYQVIARGEYHVGESFWKVSSITIIDNNVLIEGLKIYPNPTTQLLNIEFSEALTGKIELSLYNLKGEVLKYMMVNPLTSKTQLDLHELNPGVYFLGLKSHEKLHFEKVFVE